jgi:GNAT superfamily N-acetyltransferase
MVDHGAWISLKLTELGEALRSTAGPLAERIRMRRANLAGDLQGLASLYNASFGLDGLDAITPEQIAQITLHPGIDPSGAFLAMDGNLEVGLCVGSIEMPEPGGDRRGNIELLVVRPEYRRLGVGRALLHAALQWLVERGVSVVGAVVQEAEPLAILKKYGFAPADTQTGTLAQ